MITFIQKYIYCNGTLSRLAAVALCLRHSHDPGRKVVCIGFVLFGVLAFRVPRETGVHCLRAREISMAKKIPDNARDIVACALLVTTFSGSAPQYFTAASAQSSRVGKLLKLPPQPP